MKKKNEKKVKKRIYTRVNIYKENGSVKAYQGRSLGLIRPEEYALLLSSKKLKRKLFTYETKLIADLIQSSEDVDGLRYVLAIKKIDGKEAFKKKLLISEPLDYVSHSDSTGLLMVGKSGNFVELEEIQ